MKGTSEEGTGRGMGSGREEASGGGIERGMEGEQGRVIPGRYPEEDTGQYNHPTTRPFQLILCYYK